MNLRRRWLFAGVPLVLLAAAAFVYVIHLAHSGRQPLVVPSPPAACQLSPHEPHLYANNAADAAKAGPISIYKESEEALGHSAVPYNFDPAEPLAMRYLVQAQYLFRLCGDTTNGPDPQLLKLGFCMLDVRHLARAATHPDMNPNVPVSPDLHATYLAMYLSALQWDKSEIEVLTARTMWVVEVTSMPIEGTLMRRLRAVQRDVPEGVYLKLMVTQPDGSADVVFLRLAAGFAPVYENADDVPAALKG